jgi:hypothetical protein
MLETVGHERRQGMTTQQAIVKLARKQGADIGENPMIATGEHGYWVGGSFYVSKYDVSRELEREAMKGEVKSE